EGNSAVDESMLTGESLPVEKASGAKLYAGTVSQNGRLVMRVTATGEATALAQIIALVRRAQNSRANIQKLGDRVSNVFLPVDEYDKCGKLSQRTDSIGARVRRRANSPPSVPLWPKAAALGAPSMRPLSQAVAAISKSALRISRPTTNGDDPQLENCHEIRG